MTRTTDELLKDADEFKERAREVAGCNGRRVLGKWERVEERFGTRCYIKHSDETCDSDRVGDSDRVCEIRISKVPRWMENANFIAQAPEMADLVKDQSALIAELSAKLRERGGFLVAAGAFRAAKAAQVVADDALFEANHPTPPKKEANDAT